MYYINIFFIYSIIGYIIEFIISLSSNYEGGILFGFWTPIYGIGSVIIFYIYNKYLSKLKKHKFIKFLCIFLVGFFLLSLIEFIGGYLLDLIFHKIIWDYTSYKYNIGKYICLEMALIWGISSLVLIYILKNITNKIVKKIPKFITWILIILFVIDVILTVIFK